MATSMWAKEARPSVIAYDVGQVPPGQPPQAGKDAQESHAGDSEALPTAKPESSLLMSAPPHFSQVGGPALRLF